MNGRVLWILAVLLAAAVLAASSSFAEGLKGAVIDVNKGMNESEAGKAARKKMQNRQGELTREVLKIVERQWEKVVEQEKIDLLLERGSGVVHSNSSLDITSKVLDLANKEKPGGK